MKSVAESSAGNNSETSRKEAESDENINMAEAS
jgi:hypothetical protein